MITEDYVSFETAKLLKEKGFDLPVNYVYHYWTNTPFFHRKMKNFNGEEYRHLKNEWYSAPTQFLAMKWLREKEWFICIIPLAFYYGEVASQFGYNIWAGDNLEIDEFNTPKFRTYKEACEDAIKYCLKNI